MPHGIASPAPRQMETWAVWRVPQSYDLVSFAYQQSDATVFLPSGSETKAVGKISHRVCLVRHQEHEESKKQNSGSLAPSRKKSTVNSVGNSARKGKQGKEEREKARQAVPLMQDAMSMPSSGQEIQSGEPGPSVPKMNDSDAGSSKEALAKNYCSSQVERIPEHKRKREDESNVGDPNVSGKTSEGPDAPGAQSNTATEMLQNAAKEPPKKKVKIARQ